MWIDSQFRLALQSSTIYGFYMSCLVRSVKSTDERGEQAGTLRARIGELERLLFSAAITLENLYDERDGAGEPYRSAALETLISTMREASA
jgi:hypothetical protein